MIFKPLKPIFYEKALMMPFQMPKLVITKILVQAHNIRDAGF